MKLFELIQGVRARPDGSIERTASQSDNNPEPTSTDATETELVKGPPYKNKEAVKQMQAALEAMGYSVGYTGIDGLYGPRTAAAVALWKQDNNVDGNGDSIAASMIPQIMRGKRASSTAVSDLRMIDRNMPTSSNMAPTDIEQGEGSGRISQQQSGIRNQRISAELEDVISKAAEDVGVDVVIRSGGQMSRREAESAGATTWTNSSGQTVWRLNGRDVRIGSTRHDNGNAADMDVYSGGAQVALDTPLMNSFVTALVANGAKGGGGGHGYMGNRIHIDIIGTAHGGGETWRSSRQFVQAFQAGKQGIA
jgi:peptidoglycan hydrolase-like protein with peptidoglycan-binding domain